MKTKKVEIPPAVQAIATWSEEGQRLKLAKDVNVGDRFMEVYDEQPTNNETNNDN